jgi:hypothetical protein
MPLWVSSTTPRSQGKSWRVGPVKRGLNIWPFRSTSSVSKSGPVRSFALFLVQPDPDRSFFPSNFRQPDQNRHGPVANSHDQNSNRFWTGLYLDRSKTGGDRLQLAGVNDIQVAIDASTPPTAPVHCITLSFTYLGAI